MLNYINGVVSELEPNLAVIDCGGLGFGVNVSLYTVQNIKLGEKTKLYIFESVKEDAYDLYGFSSKAEKRCFELLIGVSGVGPKAAMAILSCTTPDGLIAAVMNGNEKVITAAQGVGKKLAQRILLELKDKVGKIDGVSVSAVVTDVPVFTTGTDDKNLADATAGLLVLGYGQAEINQALRGVDTGSMSSQEIIKYVLRGMVK